jgi:hypothetical protein
MRYDGLVFAAVLIACAKSEQKASDTTAAAPAAATPAAAPAAPAASISLADVAGTWEGRTMPMDKDTVLTTFEMTATSTVDGWSQKLPNGATPAFKVAVDGDSIILDSGPFASAVRKGQQVTVHTIYRLRGGNLVGLVHAKYSASDSATFRAEATRKPGK